VCYDCNSSIFEILSFAIKRSVWCSFSVFVSKLLMKINCFYRDRKYQQNFCDGMLQAGCIKFPVHKCVIGVFSEFFMNLFQTEVSITDIRIAMFEYNL